MQLTRIQPANYRGRKSRARGMSLIESLIALLVLALGIMGLAGVQARLLAESRTANSRAVAIGFIDDLSNRILFNQGAAGNYVLAWGATRAAQDCRANTCTATQLANSDLNTWRTTLTQMLPGADVSVFASANDGRQLGIAVGWPANEGKLADTDSTTYNSPFAVTSATSGVACPSGLICHVVYVQIP